MNAVEAVRTARAAGIELTLDGSCLLIDAASQPPPSVIEQLRLHKIEIVKLLRSDHHHLEERTNLSAYNRAFTKLRSKCPELIEPNRWQQAIRDGASFLATWGEQAHALGWTARELFGLHTPPEPRAASYRRLSRYDETGLIWLLRGRPVVALTQTTAAIQGATAVLTYPKLNKPALGLVGDSLDDWGTP
jgi:hypothetical protein